MPVYYFVDEQLRRNFMKSELKCPCCDACVQNTVFLDALQELRDITAKPIEVLSGYRCRRHNIKVGGSANSYHKFGRAADIRIHCCDMKDMVVYASMVDAFERGGIGIYDGGFIHVDTRGHGPARWGRIDGEYIGWDEAYRKLCR